MFRELIERYDNSKDLADGQGVVIAVISSIIAVQGGFDSGTYVFYFPAILAISVAFQPSVTLLFTATTVAVYGLISVASFGNADAVAAVTRMITIGAVGVCGSLFWQIERDRRRAAAGPLKTVESLARPRVPAGEKLEAGVGAAYGDSSPRSE